MDEFNIFCGMSGFPPNKRICWEKQISDSYSNKTVYRCNLDGLISKIICRKAQGEDFAQVQFLYNCNGNLICISRGDGLQYLFSYDKTNRLIAVYSGTLKIPLIEYRYSRNLDCPEEIVYTNGVVMKGSYNLYGQLTDARWYINENDSVPTEHYQYRYTPSGNVEQIIDFNQNRAYYFVYEGEKLVRSTEQRIVFNSSGEITERISVNTMIYVYDSLGNLEKKYIMPTNGPMQLLYCQTEPYDFGSRKIVLEVNGCTVCFISKTDDDGAYEICQIQNRSFFKSLTYYNWIFAKDSYVGSSAEIKFWNGRTLIYNMDKKNRITSICDTVGEYCSYAYGVYGQLLVEVRNGKNINEMKYDNYGNITEKNGMEYLYDSIYKDRLISVGTQSISYDLYGNPVEYMGHTLSWKKGTLLEAFDDTTYFYNESGNRIGKMRKGFSHTYILDGENVVQETWGNHILVPLYNENEVFGILYDNEFWLFQKSLQGDVLSITDSFGIVLASYRYDAWGMCEIRFDRSGRDIASVNPFRYRGYYYDCESGLYYIRGRYYNPCLGRFLTPIEPIFLISGETTVEYNLYAYCKNDPIQIAYKIDD